MECGTRLLGTLELGGAVVFAVGLAARSAANLIRPRKTSTSNTLTNSRVLILGGDKSLGDELIKQFIRHSCLVAYAGPHNPTDLDCQYYKCDPSDPRQLSNLAKNIENNFGEIDILVYAAKNSTSNQSEVIDEIVDMVDKNVIEQFHVVTNFVPGLARRSGRFVTIDPKRSHTESLANTSQAVTNLSDTLIQHTTLSGNNVKITRAHRRTQRYNDYEDVEETVAAILNAVEAGQCSVTLPTVKQHIKNILRHVLGELAHMWNDTIMRQHKLVQ